jgi:uncharacterized membrane protein YGL010W
VLGLYRACEIRPGSGGATPAGRLTAGPISLLSVVKWLGERRIATVKSHRRRTLKCLIDAYRGAASAASGRMKGLFRREIASYARAHRDRINGWMHIIGNPILFIAVVLPLCLVPITLFGLQTSLAPLLVIPALIMWMSFDLGIGLAIAATSIPLLWVAAAVAAHVSVTSVWIIAAALFVVGWALQIIGHRMFEHNWPSLIRDPLHMLMSPMYVYAKLYVALGFRPDLAALIAQPAPERSYAPVYAGNAQADIGPRP